MLRCVLEFVPPRGKTLAVYSFKTVTATVKLFDKDVLRFARTA